MDIENSRCIEYPELAEVGQTMLKEHENFIFAIKTIRLHHSFY